MNFLIFILAFVMAIDENTFTRVLHRPLVACTLFGAVLGKPAEGLACGVLLEPMAIAFDTYRKGNFILASLVSAVLVANGSETAAAVSAGAASVMAGYVIRKAIGLLTAVMLPSARKAAEKRDEKGLFAGMLVSMLIYGLVFGGLSMWLASLGADIGTTFNSVITANGWILSILQVASVLIGAVGIAVLFRNLSGPKIPGAFMAGFAAAAVCCAGGITTAAAIICGFAAFGISAMDYHLRSEQNEKPAEVKEIKKGGAQWW